MIVEKRKWDWRVTATLVVVAAMTALSIGGLETARGVTARLDRPRPATPRESLSEHLAAMDAAIEGKDRGRAAREWREAYGAALRSSRWEAMADAGDAAMRVDALASSPGFRTAARQAYRRALFLAWRDRSHEGAERVADAFAALGDVEVAARARAILGKDL
jgi:hypothetical protein